MNRSYMDAESGLIYVRARYYDPTMGQFNRDPLDTITQSAHGYVNDNPLNGTDPTGLHFGLNPLSDAAEAFNDTVGKVIHTAATTCYAGPGSSGCQSYANEYPALIPAIAGSALAAIACVAACPAIVANLSATAAYYGAGVAFGKALVLGAGALSLLGAGILGVGDAMGFGDAAQGKTCGGGQDSTTNRLITSGEGLTGGPGSPPPLSDPIPGEGMFNPGPLPPALP